MKVIPGFGFSGHTNELIFFKCEIVQGNLFYDLEVKIPQVKGRFNFLVTAPIHIYRPIFKRLGNRIRLEHSHYIHNLEVKVIRRSKVGTGNT